MELGCVQDGHSAHQRSGLPHQLMVIRHRACGETETWIDERCVTCVTSQRLLQPRVCRRAPHLMMVIRHDTSKFIATAQQELLHA